VRVISFRVGDGVACMECRCHEISNILCDIRTWVVVNPDSRQTPIADHSEAVHHVACVLTYGEGVS